MLVSSNWPGAHAVHCDLSPLVADPLPHASQFSCPPELYQSVGQASHATAATSFLCLPAAHGSHPVLQPLTLYPFGQVAIDYTLISLWGRTDTTAGIRVLAGFFTLFWFNLAAIIPLDLSFLGVVGTRYLTLFWVCGVGTTMLLVSVILLFYAKWGMPGYYHCLWFVAFLGCTLGAWGGFYGVAMVYVLLARRDPFAANIFLPLTIFLLESVFILIVQTTPKLVHSCV